jgi:hypothetical protein
VVAAATGVGEDAPPVVDCVFVTGFVADFVTGFADGVFTAVFPARAMGWLDDVTVSMPGT